MRRPPDGYLIPAFAPEPGRALVNAPPRGVARIENVRVGEQAIGVIYGDDREVRPVRPPFSYGFRDRRA